MRTETTGWTFLSNHGHVFLVLASDPEVRIRDVADEVGITERAALRIVHDLVDEGYVRIIKEGRRNRYEIDTEQPFRHPSWKRFKVGELVRMLESPAS